MNNDGAMRLEMPSTQSSFVSVFCLPSVIFEGKQIQEGWTKVNDDNASIYPWDDCLEKISLNETSCLQSFLLTARIARGNNYPNVVITDLS